MARAHSADAIATLVAICNNADAPDAARVAAANALLDRGWGRPMRSEALDADGKPVGRETVTLQILR